jgi:predicted nucleic acid-binding Zn ribbon protein
VTPGDVPPERRRGRRGRNTDGPVPLAEVLGVLSERMGVAGPDVLGAVFGRWEDLVGPTMASHVRPLRLRDGTLVVSADHPAWATQVRHLAADILAKVAAACPPGAAPDRLEVRVRA